VAPSSILESSTDAPDDRQLKNLKFQTPLATTKNGFPDTLLGKASSPVCNDGGNHLPPVTYVSLATSAEVKRIIKHTAGGQFTA
ncbi:MAG: hypothetical protein WAO83_22460, partial [Fuerstiella sp.]